MTIDQDTYIVNVDFRFGGSLHEGAVVLPCEIDTLVLAHDPLVFEVAFVAYEDHGHVVRVFYPQYLLSEVVQVVKRRLGRYRVDKHESLAVFHVQVPHGRELFLKIEQKNTF